VHRHGGFAPSSKLCVTARGAEHNFTLYGSMSATVAAKNIAKNMFKL
jgi:hypothetical protein